MHRSGFRRPLMLTVVTNTFNGNNAKKKWLRKKNKGI
jgi:hypothetical protein